jgi:hypothetical protein
MNSGKRAGERVRRLVKKPVTTKKAQNRPAKLPLIPYFFAFFVTFSVTAFFSLLAGCFANISLRLFIPFVLTFFNASTPRLPLLASALRFFAAAALPPPRESERSVLEEERPGR